MNRPAWRDCSRCNYDLHRCPGCAENLPHGIEICDACAEQADERETLIGRVLAVMPEGARHHWEYSEQSREKHGDRGCTCDLCQTLIAVRAAR